MTTIHSRRSLHLFTGAVLLVLTFILTACGGGGDGGTAQPVYTPGTPLSPLPITSFQLLDPTPGAGDNFGQSVVLLANGNIAVSDPFDSSIAARSGAVHLYNSATLTLISSIYGDTAGDQLGSDGITALANNNFVIASSFDNEGGIVDAGSVRLIDGSTGVQISSALVGDSAGDHLGSDGITTLLNNTFVIASSNDNEAGINNAGSVRLVNGFTAVQINAYVGDAANDMLGSNGITALANNNFVIASSFDDEGGIVDAGSVRLINGATGIQINVLFGDGPVDQLSSHGITALANNNFVIATGEDDIDLADGGIAINGGSVWLVDGATGVQIGSAIIGNVTGDNLGSNGVTALANNNFVITSQFDDEEGIVDAGSVIMVDGATGVQINTLVGNVENSMLGSYGVTALANNNFVIASAGTMLMVNGTTGVPINTLAGESGSITALANNNFVVTSRHNHLNERGWVSLVDGATNVQINKLVGDVTDNLGFDGITTLANNNFVIASSYDDIKRADGRFIYGGGSVRLVDGVTGVQIGDSIVGSIEGDIHGVTVTGSTMGDFYILGLPFADNNGAVDSGLVGVISQ